MPHPGRADDDHGGERARQPQEESPPGEQRPSEQPPAEQHPSEQPPAEQHPSEQPPAEQHPSEQPPAEQHPSEQPPAEQHPSEQPPAEQHPSEQRETDARWTGDGTAPRQRARWAGDGTAPRQRARWAGDGTAPRQRARWAGDGTGPGPAPRRAGDGTGWGPRGRWAGDGDAAWEPRFRFSRWARLWLPVILSFVVQVPGAVFTWRIRQFAGPAGDDEPWRLVARVSLALLGALALIAARRFPGPVVAVVSAAAGAYALLVAGEFAPPYIALAFAVVSAVVRGTRIWAWWSLGVAWVMTVTLGILLGVDWQPAAVVAVTLVLVLLLGAGEGIRTRRARIDEMRKRAAERRLTEVQAERVRIARELHDVLAHSLSQINVQAGVGLHLIDTQPEAAATALANIKETSKSALDEVRSVLGVLRAGQDASGAVGDEAPLVPEPDLSRIDGLVASVVSQGLAVTLENGIASDADAAPRTSPPPKAVQLALYRIVQESLTNVVRHAHATSATVVLAETPGAWTVSVVDDGVGPAATPTADASRARASASGVGEPRPGRGLLGMRERAELLGGRLEVGARPGGGFTVEAVIPRRAATATAPTPTAPLSSPATPTGAPPAAAPRGMAPTAPPPLPAAPPGAPPGAAPRGVPPTAPTRTPPAAAPRRVPPAAPLSSPATPTGVPPTAPTPTPPAAAPRGVPPTAPTSSPTPPQGTPPAAPSAAPSPLTAPADRDTITPPTEETP